MNNQNPWSDYEKQELRKLYPDHNNEQISILFGRSETAICKKARKMGLEKSAAFHRSGKSGRILPLPKSLVKRIIIKVFHSFIFRKYAA